MEYLSFLLSAFLTYAPQVVGFAMPLLVQVLNRDIQKETERYVVSVVACLLVAILLDWHKLVYGSPEQVFISACIIFVESNATYTLYFARSGMRAGLIKLIGGTNQLQEPLTEVQQNISPSGEGEGTQ